MDFVVFEALTKIFLKSSILAFVYVSLNVCKVVNMRSLAGEQCLPACRVFQAHLETNLKCLFDYIITYNFTVNFICTSLITGVKIHDVHEYNQQIIIESCVCSTFLSPFNSVYVCPFTIHKIQVTMTICLD